MKKKILIVTEYFYPNNTTTSYYLTEIAKKLSIKYDVHVICNVDLSNDNELKNIKITRIPENNLNKNYLILRIIKFMISSLKLSWSAYKHIDKNTHVFTVTNPAFLPIFLSILKKFKKFHYTLLVYDVFPENLLAINLLTKKSFIYKLLKKIYDWSYSHANRLIVIGRDMDEVIQKKVNNKTPTILIENWCDHNKVLPHNKNDNDIIKQLELEDKKVFLFAGNLGRVQGISNLIKASELVADIKFRLLFIGNGAMKNEILEYIDLNPNGKVLYAGSFSLEEQNLFLNACDVSIVSLNKSMYGLGVPSKSYYNMAAEKPILYIGDELSEIGRVILENDIGWVVEPNNIDRLANTFEEVCRKYDVLEKYGKKARDIVESSYSKNIILNKYEDLFSDEN